MRKYNRYDKIEVVWIDAHSPDSGWRDPESVKDDPVHIRTVGYFLKDTKEEICVMQSYSKLDDESVMHVLFIPKGCIKSIKVIG